MTASQIDKNNIMNEMLELISDKRVFNKRANLYGLIFLKKGVIVKFEFSIVMLSLEGFSHT